MNGPVGKLWSGYLQPLIGRPNRVQVGALCYRVSPEGELEVLLITSLRTQRWIIPKGWPMADRDARGAAVLEAWEEAGVRPGHVSETAIGCFTYQKVLKGGAAAMCDVHVFALEVVEQLEDHPEAGERELKWLRPAAAASLVSDEGLSEILQGFSRPADSTA